MQLLLLLLFYLPLITHAVTVTLSYVPYPPEPVTANQPIVSSVAQFCTNLRPGQCCQQRLPGGNRGFHYANFQNLEPLDIAAAWQPRGSASGCSGTPVGTGSGPGSWRFPLRSSPTVVITGASYIRLPQSIQDNRVSTPMREAQGILGLITGGTGWLSQLASPGARQQASNAAAGLGSSLGSLGLRKRWELTRRGIVSKDKGVVIAQPPPGTQWPDRITVDGRDYTEESVGSPIYRDRDGAVLDLTSLGQ